MSNTKYEFVKAVHTGLDKLIALFTDIKVEEHFPRENEEAGKLCTYYEYYLRAIKERIGTELIDETSTGSGVQVSSSTIFKMAMALLSVRDISDRITEEIEDSEGLIENVLLITDDMMHAFGEMDAFNLKAIPDPCDAMEEDTVEYQPCKKQKK